MIRGSFDRGRPLVECRLVIPRLRVNHRLVMVVDTGAVATCLHPADAIRARIPFDRLGNIIGYGYQRCSRLICINPLRFCSTFIRTGFTLGIAAGRQGLIRPVA